MPNITKVGALKASLFAILSVIVVEFSAGIMTGSLALLTDSGHAAFDALSTLILLVATSLSLKPADEDHTYGHGKIETIGALIGGVGLFILAGAIMVLGILRLIEGSTIRVSYVGFLAAGYTVIIDLLRMGILTLALKSGSATVRAGLYDAVSDFGSTALVFVALGLASVGYPAGDVVVSMILAALLVFLSARLIHSSSLELSDAISGKLVQSILREVRKVDEVLKVKELRARRVGQVSFVDVVVSVSPYAKLADADAVASKIEANLTKLLGKASVMVHLEPLDWGLPVEVQIRNASNKVEGARGIHNLSVTNVDGGLYVSLHVQVDPKLQLERAHEIAESVEKAIGQSVPQIRGVTVHLEPSMPERTEGMIVDDKYLSETIRTIINSYPNVSEISSIMTYSSGKELHINVHCVFKGEENIGRIHEMISKIEEGIKQRFPTAVVTIHPEPVATRKSRN